MAAVVRVGKHGPDGRLWNGKTRAWEAQASTDLAERLAAQQRKDAATQITEAETAVLQKSDQTRDLAATLESKSADHASQTNDTAPIHP